MKEFSIIRRLFQRDVTRNDLNLLGSGDDAAILKVPPGCVLATSTDTMVEGTHFFESADAFDVGYKCIAIGVSDVAAMGAEPTSALVALTVPGSDEVWLSRFAEGVFDCAQRYHLDIVGGDLTRGPLSITSTVNGIVPEQQVLRQNGAAVCDKIYVSGTLGDARSALECLKANQPADTALLTRLLRPTPRAELGVRLRNIASSCIDVSDGLIGDLQHILSASGVGATIDVKALPLSELYKYNATQNDMYALALSGGDDYELCFTASAEYNNEIRSLSTPDCPITCIGEVTSSDGIEYIGMEGDLLASYEHF